MFWEFPLGLKKNLKQLFGNTRVLMLKNTAVDISTAYILALHYLKIGTNIFRKVHCYFDFHCNKSPTKVNSVFQ